MDTNAWSLPFSQYIIAERGSIGWWDRDWCTIDSSRTKSDSENAESISPFVHSTAASPFGIRPASMSSKSASVHLSSLNSPPPKRLPPVYAFGPLGLRLSSGSSTKGNGSKSMSIASIAAAACSSVSAATARIGWPSYRGSSVRLASPGRPSIWRTSSARRMSMTPGIASALVASTPRTRACGMGLNNNLANTIPSALKSSAYFARPVIFATRSCGAISVPIIFSAIRPPYTLRASSAARIAQLRILS